MSGDTKALTPQPALASIAKRTLIRAFESHIAAKEQEDNGQHDDRQAPMTLLRNPDGTPRKVVIVTTDRAFAEELHDAVNKRVPVGVQLHRAPSDDELEKLSRELPRAQPPPAVLPAARATDSSAGDDVASDGSAGEVAPERTMIGTTPVVVEREGFRRWIVGHPDGFTFGRGTSRADAIGKARAFLEMAGARESGAALEAAVDQAMAFAPSGVSREELCAGARASLSRLREHGLLEDDAVLRGHGSARPGQAAGSTDVGTASGSSLRRK
jgi:hypothetical protein